MSLRANGFLTQTQDANQGDVQIEREMVFFLGTENCLSNELVTAIRNIDNYLEVMSELIETCAHVIETESYILPDEKHTFLKVSIPLSFSFCLLRAPYFRRTITSHYAFCNAVLFLSSYNNGDHLSVLIDTW